MPNEHEKNKILTWRKVFKSSNYNLCGFRMSTKKVQSCQNNSKNSYTEKKVQHKASGYAWCSICSFDETQDLKSFVKI